MPYEKVAQSKHQNDALSLLSTLKITAVQQSLIVVTAL